MSFKGGLTRESIKPLPKLHRELEEKIKLPKGMVSKGIWEKKVFKSSFKKEKG